jgi:hypothetical protein
MRRKPQNGGKGIMSDSKDFSAIYSEIPWQDYIDRMFFTGKIPKGAQTSNRSITIEASELRLAEMIKESCIHFQTISDVVRDSLRKGIAINYEILVRRKPNIKFKADATYLELAYVDKQLAILAHIEMVEKRIVKLLEESKKNIAGHGDAWAEDQIMNLIKTAEADYPNEGVQEYLEGKFFHPTSANAFVFEIEKARKIRNLQR